MPRVYGVVSKVFREGIRYFAPNYCRQTQCENLTTFKKLSNLVPAPNIIGYSLAKFSKARLLAQPQTMINLMDKRCTFAS